MDINSNFSLLQPSGSDIEYRELSDHVMHDLGLDTFGEKLSNDAKERRMIMNVLSKISSDSAVAIYRQQIFGDILRLPGLRNALIELFDQIQFMRDFSTLHTYTTFRQP